MKFQELLKGFSEGFGSVVNKTEARFDRVITNFERKLNARLARIKRKIFATFFQLLILGISFTLLTLGAILFLTRFFSLDIILLVSGILLLYVAVILSWITK